MHLIRIGINGHSFVVSCPSKPDVFHDCYATCEEKGCEEELEGLLLIGKRFYEPDEVIDLAYGEQRGFKMISAV